MEVWDGLAAVRAVVDHDAESAFRAALVSGDLRGGEEQVTEDGLVFRGCITNAGDDVLGDDEDVDGCLRGNVAEGEAMFVAVDHIGGDLTVADFLKNRLHCVGNLAGKGLSGKCEKIRRSGDSCSSTLRGVRPMA
jgi:hypothetical protein